MGTVDTPAAAPARSPQHAAPRPARSGRGGARSGGLRRLTGRWSWLRVVVVLASLVAPAVLSYPSAANWFRARDNAHVISGYINTAQGMTPERVQQVLQDARRYNENLPDGPLRDPYALGPDGKPIPIGLGKDAYEDLLSIGSDRVMARLRVPGIKVDLPVFHDTGTDSLEAGVGHLYGSGLPVGGAGTHSVLTAHSGVVGSTLFSNLHKLKIGDTFQVQVLTETMTYQVSEIRTVLPNELDSLRQRPGQDLVTLVTCTPIGANTHRLLVTGTRVPTPEPVAGEQAIAGASGPGFPWWPFPVPAVAAAAILLTRTTRVGTRRAATKQHAPTQTHGAGDVLGSVQSIGKGLS